MPKKTKTKTYPTTRRDGVTVEVTIPAREESEGAQVVRLADEVLAAANGHREDTYWERADLLVALHIGEGGTTWTAALGNARVDGAGTAVEALTSLVTIVTRYPNTTRGA
jgi:hypothetical protein